MSGPSNRLQLSNEAVLLLAANLASIPQLSSLQALILGYPDVLHFTTVLEILLKIVPETTSPEDYLRLLYKSYRGDIEVFEASRISNSSIEQVKTLSQQACRRKLLKYQLNLSDASVNIELKDTLLANWFLDRARRVEKETGMIDLARRLVLPDTGEFPQTPTPFPPKAVTVWGKGIIQVLENFIFDNDDEDELQLILFENLDPDSAIRLLLSRTTPEAIPHTVQKLIQPYINYLNFQQLGGHSWGIVWDWLVDRAAAGELEYISILAGSWVEIEDTTLREFLQTCLTACYICHSTSSSIRKNLRIIQRNTSRLSERLHLPPSEQPISLEHPETDLVPAQLRNSSPLTNLTTSSFTFLDHIITSADILAKYSVEYTPAEIVIIRAKPEDVQAQLIDNLIHNEQSWTKRTDEQWRALRQSIRWLHDQSGVLQKLSLERVDTMILSAILDAAGFDLARDMFVRSHALSGNALESTILQAFYRFYDSATNGNRTRGNMKNAFQTLHVLDDPSATASTVHAVKLVKATHALSNYSLSLTPGVPITPVQIRMNNDPAILVTRVIQSNSSVYQDKDRMLNILDDLIDGTELFKQSAPVDRQLNISRMRARVNAAIVEAALSQNDFTVAYKVCYENLGQLVTTYPKDEVIIRATWPVYYHTATYTSSAHRRLPSRSSASNIANIDNFQRMELLGRAILICPKTEIQGILRTWKDFENRMLYPEQIPTTSGRPSSEDHGGLLSAAADIARRASPLLRVNDRREGGSSFEISSGEHGWGTSQSRFGVRDTVKTGLTQGIGWLLGATPQAEPDRRDPYQ